MNVFRLSTRRHNLDMVVSYKRMNGYAYIYAIIYTIISCSLKNTFCQTTTNQNHIYTETVKTTSRGQITFKTNAKMINPILISNG